MSEDVSAPHPRLVVPGLYAVTPDECDTACLLAAVERVIAGGPSLLQYRNKRADPALRREQALAVQRVCRHGGVPLIINDDLDLALELGADGVHLGRDDGDLARARAALGQDRILGVSCYAEWPRAVAAVSAGADYVAFGAMFPSSVKPQAVRAPFELLARARAEFDVAVVAIGGITLDRAVEVRDAGADLVAVITDLFGAPDPEGRARAYRALFRAAD